MVGTSIAHYKITAKIGQGAMGEVYRATDTKLGREVAIKVLPESFAADPQRLARFHREAQVLASLNHPNIAAIYGVEERALIMELVEGPDLAGPVSVAKAVDYARQISAAMESAHDTGITHRDLKPANIKVTKDGVIKVLDFGLAKATEQPGSSDENAPTLSLPAATAMGLIIGTPAYMSPEQARGELVDRRTDIWAFGAILYELLTGKRAFSGDTISDTLAKVLTVDPDLTRIPADTPRHVRTLLERCLEKDRKKRLRDIADAWVAGEPQQTTAPRPWRWMAAAAVLVVALIASLGIPRQATTNAPLMQFDVDFGPNAQLGFSSGVNALFTPDGQRLVFLSTDKDNVPYLSTRRVDQSEATLLQATKGVYDFFLSPDGQWIAFFAAGKLRKIPIEGGGVADICDAVQARGGWWGEDRTIVASLEPLGGLSRVSANGGIPAPVTTPSLKDGDVSHRWPQLLPGGKYVLFTSGQGGNFDLENTKVEVAELASGKRRVLQRGAMFGRYAPSGHLLFLKNGTLFTANFDPGGSQDLREPVPVLNQIEASTYFGWARVAFSGSGHLLFQRGEANAGGQVIKWMDRNGTMQPLVTKRGAYNGFQFSPDGSKLAFVLSDGTGWDIWVQDLKSGGVTRLTFTREFERPIVWSPDGRFILYSQTSGGIFALPSQGGQPVRLLDTSPSSMAFAPDGRLFLSDRNKDTGIDIKLSPIDWTSPGQPRAGKPQPFLSTTALEAYPTVSPDGRWLAYTSSELAGQFEVFVRAAAASDSGRKWLVSAGGGTHSAWSRSGRELFYRTNQGHLMSVAFTVQGENFSAAPPRQVPGPPLPNVGGMHGYDPAPDGSRLAVIQMEDQEGRGRAQTHATVMLNFFDELRRKAPAR